jgi:type IV secretion system protein VirB10
MKSKFTKVSKTEAEQQDQDTEESSELEAGGPAIASAKKNRIIIIAVSSVLITVVVYFVFFKSSGEPKPENLQEVQVTPPSTVIAGSDSGKSLFEPEIPKDKVKEEVDILDKPAVPEIPSLPESATPIPEANPLPDANQQLPNLANQPGQQLIPNQQQNANGQAVQQQNASTEKQDSEPKPVNPRYAPIVVFSGGAENAPALGVGYEKNIVNLSENALDKLEKSKVTVKTTLVGDRVHSITQGKLLTAVLETAINTEIPGSVRGIISRDVYGESGNEVLIPKGSRLYGSYSSKIVKGQGRVDISWTRLIRPDGVDLAISFSASDQFGRSGIEGEVNNKYGSIVAGSLLTSVLAVGSAAAVGKLLGGNTSVSTTTSNGATTTTGTAANQAIADVTKTIIDTAGTIVGNTLDITPVIRVPQGTKVTVIVNADMNLPSMIRR